MLPGKGEEQGKNQAKVQNYPIVAGGGRNNKKDKP
jgi:hypothetical protein